MDSRIITLGLLVLIATGIDAMPRVRRQQPNPPRDLSKPPEFILKCYNRDLYNETNSLPMTMENLVAIVRKIERTYLGKTYGAPDLASTLLWSFRFDGMKYNPNADPNTGGAMFAPDGSLLDNLKVLMHFVPSIYHPNFEVLSFVEKCSLHFMLSYNVNRTKLNDYESCDPLRPVNFMVDPQEIREKREVSEESETMMEKVMDFFEPILPSGMNRHSKRQTVEIDPNESKCPRESGIVYTKWGTVAVGSVLSGIVTGAYKEPVSLSTAVGSCNQHAGLPTTLQGDNGWLATLAGPLAEYALEDLTAKNKGGVGLGGWWRDYDLHKEYHLKTPLPSHLTESELIGGIDGWLLYNNARDWNSHGVKLSQVLDMYYSESGVFNLDNLRACNRYNTLKKQFDYTKFKDEARFFGYVLFCNSTHTPIEDPKKIDGNVEATVQETRNAIDKLAINANCSHSLNDDTNPVYKPNVDLYILPDFTATAHDFTYQQQLYASLAQNIDVSPFNSRIAVVVNGSFLIGLNSSFNGAELAERLYYLNYTSYGGGSNLNLDGNLKFLQDFLLNQKTQITGTTKVNAPVIFIVSDGINYPDNTKVTLVKLIKDFRQKLPYVRIMTLSNNQDRYKDIVSKTKYNLQKNNYANGRLAGSQITQQNLALIPTPLLYPQCNMKTATLESGHVFTGYVAQGHANLYKYDPDNFYSSKNLNITFQSSNGLLRVCNSRDRSDPLTSPTCQKQANTDTPLSFSISNPCGPSHDKTKCNPLYFTVQGTVKVHAPHEQVPVEQQRYPDQIKYTIIHDQMRCSGALGYLASPFVIALSVILTFRNMGI